MRRIAVGVAAGLLLLPATGASAQESPPETGEIGNGTAKGTALIARIGPGVGDLELAMRAGLAITQVTNQIAQSTGQILDLGLIGSSLTAEGCDGDATLKPEDLPQPTDVDNRSGHAALTESESGDPAAPLSIGHKDVEAFADPVGARSTTTGGRVDLPGVVHVDGGRAESITAVLPGEGREATATVNASVTIGPLTLGGLEWRAYHRTGADPTAEASFRIASLAGMDLIDVPLDNLYQLEDAINGVFGLLGTGVTVEFPRVERFLEPNDVIRITPLRIAFEDSPLGQSLIAPLKVATQDVQSALFEAAAEAVCDLAAVLFVADIGLTVAAGSGFLRVDIGGAEATTSRFDVTSPFTDPVVPAVPPVPETAPPSFTPPSPTGAPATVAAPPTTELAAPETVPSATRGPLEQFCASVHPNGNSCDEGAALALGLLGILLTIAVAGYEVRKQWPGSGGAS